MELKKAVTVWCALYRRFRTLDGITMMAPDEDFAIVLKSERQMILEALEDLERQFEVIAPFHN